MVALAAGAALAVGYDRCTVHDPRAQPSASEKIKDSRAVWKALNDAFKIEKIPSILDRATLTVKDIAGQFGLAGPGSRYGEGVNHSPTHRHR